MGYDYTDREGYAVGIRVCTLNQQLPNHEANAVLIETAVNEYDRLKQIEEAARMTEALLRLVPAFGDTIGKDISKAQLGCAHNALSQALASTPEQARAQQQQQAEYVRALEELAEAAQWARSDRMTEAERGDIVDALNKLKSINI